MSKYVENSEFEWNKNVFKDHIWRHQSLRLRVSSLIDLLLAAKSDLSLS